MIFVKPPTGLVFAWQLQRTRDMEECFDRARLLHDLPLFSREVSVRVRPRDPLWNNAVRTLIPTPSNPLRFRKPTTTAWIDLTRLSEHEWRLYQYDVSEYNAETDVHPDHVFARWEGFECDCHLCRRYGMTRTNNSP